MIDPSECWALIFDENELLTSFPTQPTTFLRDFPQFGIVVIKALVSRNSLYNPSQIKSDGLPSNRTGIS